jgi:hypothetical protein
MLLSIPAFTSWPLAGEDGLMSEPIIAGHLMTAGFAGFPDFEL